MITLEEEAMAAWMMGSIVLPSLPHFLVCTHPQATRVAIYFFEAYLKGKVVSFVPPYVRTLQHIAEKTLLLQLLERREGDTELDALSREPVKGAKRKPLTTQKRGG